MEQAAHQTDISKTPYRIGIICEYNPFHNGHAHQISVLRKKYPGCCIICLMSGSFTQRGTPALLSKYTRAKAAAACGADVVLELPPAYALSSAASFARGGVRILSALGADALCFGVETSACPNDDTASSDAFADSAAVTEALTVIAERLDSPAFTQALEQEQKTAENAPLGYPALVQKVYTALYRDDTVSHLLTPNNILAIEYLRAIRECTACGMPPMTPIAIPRIGAAHDAPIPDGDQRSEEFASASAVRALLTGDDPASAWKYLPAEWKPLLQADEQNGYIVKIYEPLLGTLLLNFYRNTAPKIFSKMQDVESHISEPQLAVIRRLCRAARECVTLHDLYAHAAAKHLTDAAVRRTALRGFFGITEEMEHTPPYYLNLLARANTEAASIFLRSAAKRSHPSESGSPAAFPHCPPILCRPAMTKKLSAAAQCHVERYTHIDEIWGMLTETPIPASEWMRMNVFR